MLEGHDETMKSIDAALQGIKRDMLLNDNYESLAGRAGGLKDGLMKLRVDIKLRVNIKCLLKTSRPTLQ